MMDKMAIEKMFKAGFDKKWVKMKIGDDNSVDILKFLKYLQKTEIDIINRFLRSISREAYHTSDHYSIWKMLNFPMEPYVL